MRDYKEDIALNKTQGKEHFIPCSNCLSDTRHKTLLSADVDGETNDGYLSWTEKYQIIQCQGCDSISFRQYHTDSESVYQDESGFHQDEKVEIYPSRVAGRKKLRQSYSLPLDIRRIYDETHSALCNKLPILAGIGIRALIESVCKEKNAVGYTLEKKIDSLTDLGVLTKIGADVLHSMRILGNEAAHEVKPHSEETLNLAMDVVENLLSNVYILPDKVLKKPDTENVEF